jgi:proteasome lid subunit RPN8/RPN11
MKDNLYIGQCKSQELPAQIDLTDISDTVNALWKKSICYIERVQVVEYAATIVLNLEGRLCLRNIVSGDSTSVNPTLAVSAGEIFVGTFHTHPYESGLTGMAFSGADIASAINANEAISVVQSGDVLFALVRTEKTSPSADLSAFGTGRRNIVRPGS